MTSKFTNQFGKTYDITFEKTSYIYGGIAIVATFVDDSGWKVPYGVLTVNIGETGSDKIAHLDSNNSQSLVDWVIESGWAKVIGEGRSGYCTYPLVEFTDEFLDEICFDNGVV